MSNIKKGIVVCLLAAVLLVSMVGMATSADKIKFYLDSDTDTGGSGQYVMWWNDKTKSNDNVFIDSGSNATWTADEPAACNVGFSDGKSWRVTIARSSGGNVQKFRVYIGYYDGSSFHQAGDSGERTLDAADMADSFNMPTSAFTIPEGEWLAVQVESSTSINIETMGEDSSIAYFYSPPDYPYPELNTLVLLGVGLLTLVGYVTYRRRNDKK